MKKITLFFIIFIVFSCSVKDRRNANDIFNPDFHLTYKDIENQGFKFPYGEVDVPMFTKQFGDTTVAFQFDDSLLNESKPFYMWVEFPLDSSSIGEYYWHNNNCVVLCQSKNNFGDSFILRNTKNNLCYGASIQKSEDDTTKFKIFIDFHFPKLEGK